MREILYRRTTHPTLEVDFVAVDDGHGDMVAVAALGAHKQHVFEDSDMPDQMVQDGPTLAIPET